MAYQVLEVTLVSAKDLKRVTLFSKMRVYAVASITGGGPRLPTHRTYADREGGRNPMWRAPLRFTIPPAADPRGLALHVLLRAERAFGDRDVGEVLVPVRDLAAAAAPGQGEQRHLSYQVRRPVSGRHRGVLHISYKLTDAPAPDAAAAPFGDHRPYVHGSPAPASSKRRRAHHNMGAADAITAYPVAPRSGPSYGPPPPYGGAASYAYGGQQGAAPAARAGGGVGTAGLGLGLLGGAVGGMMLGEMVADADIDGGFMDGMGF
ncbi:hypothetical protein U9M48_041932 [Paspalum notatum var. saurae]|uniref:C2 domain-containing protein n=1 Tax=Paspalum notatum var. saurae TaxID=547442 RepID=A0AAQ3URM0_PASNO